MTQHALPGYKLYWFVWGFLLLLTIAMLFADSSSIPRIFFLFFVLLAMLVKASLIGGYFMHLRFEKRGLILTVALSILLTSAALFFLLIPDAFRVYDLSQ